MSTSIGERAVIEQSIKPQTISTNTTVNGTAFDTAGYMSVAVVFSAGTLADGTYALTVQDSADGSTGWADVDAAELNGTLSSFTSSNDEDDQWLGVLPPSRRYLRTKIVSTSVTTGGEVAAFFIGFDPQVVPTAHGV